MPRIKIGSGGTRAATVALASGDSLIVERGGRLSILGEDPAARLGGGATYISNNGTIDSYGSAIVGSGTIKFVNRSDGTVLGQDGSAIAITSGALQVVNDSGSITAYVGAGITVAGTLDLRNLGYGTIAGKQGVHSGSGSIFNDTNALIEGRTYAIQIDDGSGGAVHDATRIINLGTIIAKVGAAIRIIGDGDDRIVNYGSIECANTDVGIDTGGGNDRLINFGTIEHAVNLGDGDDFFGNAGTVFGLLDGGAGDDRIVAGPGNTRIVGGLGRDVLTGGAGSDRFEYRTIADSAATLATADRITDFDTPSGDVVYLVSIDADSTRAGNQAFSNIGTQAFSGNAGELRTVAIAAGVAVFCDVDGDAIADFALLLVGLTDPSATQFIL